MPLRRVRNSVSAFRAGDGLNPDIIRSATAFTNGSPFSRSPLWDRRPYPVRSSAEPLLEEDAATRLQPCDVGDVANDRLVVSFETLESRPRVPSMT